MSVPSWCMPVVALLIFCHISACDVNLGRSPQREPKPDTIDGVFRKANGGPAGKTVTHRTAGGREDIMDGYDMMISKEQYRRLYEGGNARDARRVLATPWTNGEIPYTIEEDQFTPEHVSWIHRAMKNWEDVTCVRFRPANSNDMNKINIHTGSGCWAHLGMMGGEQQVNLDPYCFWKGTIEHELGHTIGLIHEHQRSQRDAYIRVNYYPLSSNMIGSLTKYARGSDDKMGLDYDYTSVMHYGKTAFAEDWITQTIFTRDPSMEDTIGMIMGPSFTDAKLVNLMYKCQDRCQSPRRCSAGCFLTQDCQCFCENAMPRETCEDHHNSCPQWARKGECRANGFYMHTFCRQSCRICNSDGTPAHLPCWNADQRCEGWAHSGECKNNPGYMRKGCAPACGECDEGWGTPAVQGPCRDKRPDCQALVAKGECNRNPAMMLKDCRQSCDFCHEKIGDDPSDKPGCVDFDTVCQYQAEFDKCRKLYTSMVTECAQHCGTCNVTVDFPADCVDNNVECRSWAAGGDCDTNDFTRNNCKRSCNLCSGIEMPDEIAKQCKDGNPNCPGWAATGECHKNPNWMKLNCRNSCAVCSNKTLPDRCTDWNTKCAQWASDGECERNPGWMLINCVKSCDVTCKGGNGNGDGNGNGNGNGTGDGNGDGDGNGNGNGDDHCADDNENCPAWADNGGCNENPGYMLRSCKRSCDNCVDPSHCVDDNQYCPDWAKHGECQRNPGNLLRYCKKSCHICEPPDSFDAV